MQRLDPKIDIIVLDVNYRGGTRVDFYKRSASEKIQHLAALIEEAMEQFKQKSDSNMKIFAWREHVIADPDSNFCDNQTRKLLKSKMRELAVRYPNICIIAGTVATKKELNNYTLENYQEIKQAYDHPILKRYRSASINKTEPGQALLHYQQLKKTKNVSKVTVFFNTCYVFQGEITYRRDKLAPHEETESSNVSDQVVFRPGSGKTANPIIRILNTNTDEPLAIAIEICVEHAIGYLKEVMKGQSILQRPAIHFVLSDVARADSDRICAKNFMYVDSFYKPRLAVIDNPENQQINYYQINALSLKPTMKGPLGEIHIKTHNLYDDALGFVEENIKRFSKKEDNFSLSMLENYEKIKEELKNKSYKQDKDLLRKFLVSYLDAFNDALVSLNEKIDKLEGENFIFHMFNYGYIQTLNREKMELKISRDGFKNLAKVGYEKIPETKVKFLDDAKEKTVANTNLKNSI